MIKLNIEKFMNSLSETEDRGCHDDNPVLKYLHELIVLNTMENKSPSVSEINFDAFTMADLEEYYKTTIDAVENIFPKVEQLVKDMESIKAFQAISLTYF